MQIAMSVLASLLILATTATERISMASAVARPLVPAESAWSGHRSVDEKAQQPDAALYLAHRQLPGRESSCADPPQRRLYEASGPRSGPPSV